MLVLQYIYCASLPWNPVFQIVKYFLSLASLSDSGLGQGPIALWVIILTEKPSRGKKAQMQGIGGGGLKAFRTLGSFKKIFFSWFFSYYFLGVIILSNSYCGSAYSHPLAKLTLIKEFSPHKYNSPNHCTVDIVGLDD